MSRGGSVAGRAGGLIGKSPGERGIKQDEKLNAEQAKSRDDHRNAAAYHEARARETKGAVSAAHTTAAGLHMDAAEHRYPDAGRGANEISKVVHAHEKVGVHLIQ